jgi:hypothetical protein
VTAVRNELLVGARGLASDPTCASGEAGQYNQRPARTRSFFTIGAFLWCGGHAPRERQAYTGPTNHSSQEQNVSDSGVPADKYRMVRLPRPPAAVGLPFCSPSAAETRTDAKKSNALASAHMGSMGRGTSALKSSTRKHGVFCQQIRPVPRVRALRSRANHRLDLNRLLGMLGSHYPSSAQGFTRALSFANRCQTDCPCGGTIAVVGRSQ